jgi:hypothetical protein
MTAPVADQSGTPKEPSKRPADTEQARRTWAVAQETVDDVAETTERILRERDHEPPSEQAPSTLRDNDNP